MFGFSLDNQAILPARSRIQAVTGPRGTVRQVVAQAQNSADVRPLQREIEGIMRMRRRLRPSQDNDFPVAPADSQTTQSARAAADRARLIAGGGASSVAPSSRAADSNSK